MSYSLRIGSVNIMSVVEFRALVSAGAKGAAAPVNFGQWVHAPVNFQAWYFLKTFLLDFSC